MKFIGRNAFYRECSICSFGNAVYLYVDSDGTFPHILCYPCHITQQLKTKKHPCEVF